MTLKYIEIFRVSSCVEIHGSTCFKRFLPDGWKMYFLGVQTSGLHCTMWQNLLQQCTTWPLGEVFGFSILAPLCHSTLRRCSIYFNVHGRGATDVLEIFLEFFFGEGVFCKFLLINSNESDLDTTLGLRGGGHVWLREVRWVWVESIESTSGRFFRDFSWKKNVLSADF